MIGEMVESGDIAPGDTLKIMRDDLTCWIEEAIEEINEKQAEDGFYITKAFPKCGLDYRVDDWDQELPAAFKKHLDSLSEDGLYKSLTKAHEATKLVEKAPPSNVCTSLKK